MIKRREKTTNSVSGQNGARRMVLIALLLAIVIVLSFAENLLLLPMPAPGVKLGLSNIVIMYVLFFLGKKDALILAVLKSLFVFVTRGAAASLLSLCGGLLSLAVMILFLYIFRDKISYLLLSILGAVFHNIGQIIAVSLLYANLFFLAYFPVLLLSGIIAGTATAALLRVTLPALKRLGLHKNSGT